MPQKIQAGQAYVELVAQDSGFRASLQRASAALSDLGAKMFATGKIIAAAGAAMTAPFVVAMKNFVSMGEALSKLAEQTGVSARALAEISSALESTGAKTDALGTGLSSMATFLDQAAQHSHTARKELSRLGLNFAELQAMDPEQRFEAIAHAIGAIADPSRQAAAAMAVFGSHGDDLLPLLKNLDKLRAEAVASGMVPSKAAIENAAAIGKATRVIRQAWSTLQTEVASAFAAATKSSLATMKGIIAGVTNWVKKNQALVSQMAQIAKVVAIAGAVISAVGVTLFAASTACGVLSGAIATVGAMIGALLSPLALITGGVIYGVSAWAQYTDAGQKTVATLSRLFGDLSAVAKDSIGGITDALTAGDLELAGKIAVTGLKLIFATGMSAVSKAIGGLWGDTLAKLTGDIVHGDLSSAWGTALLSLSSLWDKFCAGIFSAFKPAMKAVVGAWEGVTNWMARKIAWLMTQFDNLRTWASRKKMSWKEWFKDKLPQLVVKFDLHEGRRMIREREAEKQRNGPQRLPESLSDRRNRLNAAMAAAGMSTADDIGDGGEKSIRQQVGGSADSMRGWLDEEEQRRQDKSADSGWRVADAASGHEDDTEEERIALQAQLDFLRMKAAREKDAAAKDADEENDKHQGAGAGTADSIAGTFSAAALGMMGGSGNQSVPLQTLEEARNSRKEAREAEMQRRRDNAEMIRALRAGGVIR